MRRELSTDVAHFDHEDKCEGTKESIGQTILPGGMMKHKGWFCKDCNRLMMGGKMWKFIAECSRKEVVTKLERPKKSLFERVFG